MKTLIEKLKALRLYFVRRSYSLRWKLHIWNIKLFHKDEWIIYPNGRMYNKQQLNDAWNNLKVGGGDVEHIKRFNESDENLNISDVSDSDLFHDDGQALLEPLSNLLHPLYKKHGLEKTKEFLESIINIMDDVGSEFFGE